MIVRRIAERAVFSSLKMAKAELLSGERVFSGLNCFLPGQAHQLHTHPGQDKLYLVIEGRGEVTVGERTERVEAGDLVLAREGEPHSLANPGPASLVVLTIMAPPPKSKPKQSNPRGPGPAEG